MSPSASSVTRDKRVDLQRQQTTRSVFQCHVIGPRGAGKTAFLQGFLGRNLNYVATLNKEHMSRFASSSVLVYGQEKHLVVSSLSWIKASVLLQLLHEKAPSFTVCFVGLRPSVTAKLLLIWAFRVF